MRFRNTIEGQLVIQTWRVFIFFNVLSILHNALPVQEESVDLVIQSPDNNDISIFDDVPDTAKQLAVACRQVAFHL